MSSLSSQTADIPAPRQASANLQPCELYLDHGSSRPVITQGHHVFPVYLQNRVYGHIRDGKLAYLCGTCHDSVHAWLYYLLGERKVPLSTVPNRAKAMAEVAAAWYERTQVQPELPFSS